MLLTALAMIPLVLLLVAEAEASRQDVITAAHARAVSLARIGAGQESKLIQEVQDVFRVLGRVPVFGASAPGDCSSVFKAIVSDHPQILFLATTDLAGRIICASAPKAVGADVNGWSGYHAVSGQGGRSFALTEPKTLPGVPGTNRLAAMAPLHESAPDAGTLIAELDLGWFMKIAGEIKGAPENRAAIIDPDTNTPLVMSPAIEPARGRPPHFQGSLTSYRRGTSDGRFDGFGAAHERYIYGYAAIQPASGTDIRTDAFLAVGIARRNVIKDADRRLALWLGLAALTMVLALLAAARFAESSILRPLRRLTTVARRLGDGELGARVQPAHIPVDELRLLGTTLNTMGAALQKLALSDGLTSIANRRHFDQALLTEIVRACRHGQTVALLMIDVDYFKSYNDRYGHNAGDVCLTRIAACLQALSRRPADLVARYGGEEFAMLLPATEIAGAAVLAETVLAAIRALAIPHSELAWGVVTVSIGVGAILPQDPEDGGRLLVRADKALYEAKRAGRNQVCAAAEHPILISE